MRWLTIISVVITIVGVLLFVAALALGWSSVWTLGGLLVIWTGIIKLGMVLIWRRVGVSERPGIFEP
ncbi:MAG: hypothetical protein IT337_02655 [Thermomicrobiales bacterium]|nr:hypothetical protein [Thermomicrobiales bacterium]